MLIIDSVQSGTRAAQFPPTRPFVLYSGTDITGTADGNSGPGGPENYCDLSFTSASRYRLNRADHNNIFQFYLTAGGGTRQAFCLDKFKDGPYGVSYRSGAFETAFPDAAARQKTMTAWLLANAYPAVSAAQTFDLAGVNASASPALDDNDAYAAVQVAIWVLLGQIAPAEAYFLECGADAEHPKSERLHTAVMRLIELAGNYADAVSFIHL
ncbi:thioester domain-containing protein [Bacilliculturomica massiliensis]|uniref:thioester domain-containing protein n=1 Tax=Bacilliculturomica massiliensis TaxID=1917867 RepID=UPI0010326165|nr:thioester domain-containing protein [Bacilliculturomica massiliensis]